ncbi:MAG: ATP-binding protein [Candidatus Limnocylindrales bacterium]
MTGRDLTTLEQLRLLPDVEQVEWLRARPEGQWLDRKSPRIRARTLADGMIGFANAEGGLICIGIEDGRVEGIQAAARLVNEWRQAAIDFTVPPVRHRFELIDCVTVRGDFDHVAVIEIEASERVHENSAGETYLRVGDENRRLGPFEAQELRYDKGESTFDGRAVADSVFGDLDTILVQRYLRAIHGLARPETALRSRGLLTDHEGTIRPTVAGILVLGRTPQVHFPQATLRLIRYHGSSRESGARSNVAGDVRVDGPLPAQIALARRRLRRWLPTALRLGPDGRFVGSGTIVPDAAWLEAIVNAVVHRSYTIGGDHIRVELFDDRLEVESPGRLPGLVRFDNIRSTRFARNPRIARAVADLNYGRELGEGVNRMYEEMERAGLPDPVFAQTAASLRVTFLADPLSARILSQLPRGSERFVEHLSRTGRVTTSQAIQLLGVTRPTALTYLHRLEGVGLIEAVRTSPNDPRGFWRMQRLPSPS